MVKSANIEDHEEAVEYDTFAARNDSSAGEMAKVDGRSSEQNSSTHRSKHSETEQRRRSKINERFQTLMGLIPQNERKRDKASFLLEVIQYIQYLQEKLQMYEGSNQGWNQGPTKLTPWRNNQRIAENPIDHSPGFKDRSTHEDCVIPQALPPNTPNPMDSDIDAAVVYKPLDHTPGLAITSVPCMKTEANILASIGRNDLSPQISAQSVTDADDIIRDPPADMWLVRPSVVGSAALNDINDWEYPVAESGPVNFSSIYSQGVANALTQAFQSSGLDLSQAKISVELNVIKSTDNELTAAASVPKADDDQNPKTQTLSGEQRFYAESDQARKRIRR